MSGGSTSGRRTIGPANSSWGTACGASSGADGLATEGSRALIAYAFTRLDAPLVVAATLLANTGSRRVMEKAGMSFVGEFVEDRWSGPDKRAVKYAVYRDRTLPADGADGASGGLPGLEGPEPEVRA